MHSWITYWFGGIRSKEEDAGVNLRSLIAEEWGKGTSYFGDIEGRKIERILIFSVQVSTLHVYEYEVREEKGSGQKATDTRKVRIRALLRIDPLEEGIDHSCQGGSTPSRFYVCLYFPPPTYLVSPPPLSVLTSALAPSPHSQHWWIVVFGDSERPLIACQLETEGIVIINAVD